MPRHMHWHNSSGFHLMLVFVNKFFEAMQCADCTWGTHVIFLENRADQKVRVTSRIHMRTRQAPVKINNHSILVEREIAVRKK